MSSFNRVGCTHSAAHQGLMNGILRGEWNWNGFLMTDSVKSAQYFLPRECLAAGNNQMLGGSNNGKAWNFTVETVEADPVLQAGVRDSFHHKLYVYVNSALLNGMTAESAATGNLAWWVLLLRIAMGLSFAGFGAFLVLYILQVRKERRA